MSNIARVRSFGLVVATLAAALASAPAGADECKAVNISVDNQKIVKIKALKIEYKFEHDGTWRTEQFGDTEVAAGQTTVVARSQNLAGGEGNRLLSMKLHYKAFCGGKWSVEKVATDSSFDNDTGCSKGRTYRFDLSSADVCN